MNTKELLARLAAGKLLTHSAGAMFCISAMLLLAGAPSTIRAGIIPYPDTGTVNPTTYTFVAMNTGDVDAYFVGAGGAAFSENLGMLVNGVASPAGEGLNNQTSSQGDLFDLGHVNAGDIITFYIDVWTGPGWGNGTYLGKAYSDPSLNGTYDGGTGINHVYSTPYDSSSNQFPGVPSGIYVGFEDLPLYYGPDYNYTDEQYVFTDVGAVTAPDTASTITLLGIALTCLGVARRRLHR